MIDGGGGINGNDIVEDVDDEDSPWARTFHRARSIVQPADNWLVDTSAADVTTNKTRQDTTIISNWTTDGLYKKTKLMILVKLANDELFGRDAPLIDTAQETREMESWGAIISSPGNSGGW